MKIRRLIFLVVSLVVLIAVPVMAQVAPVGTLKLSFPYVPPPEGHFNSYTTRTLLGVGVNTNLIRLPSAFYKWAEGVWEPMLAESFGFVDDNSAYEITLRSDALWSDGSPITAQDLYDTYTIGKILQWPEFSYVDDVEMVDEQTVRFNLHTPSTLVERLLLVTAPRDSVTYGELAAEARALIDSGATNQDEAWTTLRTKITDFRPETALFSGPYMFDMADVTDAQILMHWQPNSIYSGTVQWGEVIIWAGEEDVVTPLVLSGDLHYSTNAFSASALDQFRAQGITLAEVNLGFGPALFIQHDTAPLNILEVRKAIAHAINRDEVAAAVVAAKPVQYMVGFPEHLYSTWLTEDAIARLDPYEYDWDKADAYLTEAGFTRDADGKWVDSAGAPVAFEITVPAEFAGFTVAAEQIGIQLNDYGLAVTIRGVPDQQHIEEVRNSNFQAAMRISGTGQTHPRQAYFFNMIRWNSVDPDLIAGGLLGYNFPMQGEFNGEAYDFMALYDETAAGFDVAAQQEKVGEIAYLFNQLLPIIPIVEEIRLNPMNESAISGVPAADDPIWQNTQSDNFFIWGVLNGTIVPAG